MHLEGFCLQACASVTLLLRNAIQAVSFGVVLQLNRLRYERSEIGATHLVFVDVEPVNDSCGTELVERIDLAAAVQDLTDSFPVNKSLPNLGTKAKPKGFSGKFEAEGKLRQWLATIPTSSARPAARRGSLENLPDGPQIDPNPFQIDPKSAPNQFQISPKSTPRNPQIPAGTPRNPPGTL